MKDLVRIDGGAPVDGTIRIRGSKNALPKIMVASLLTPEPVQINNISDITDTQVVSEFLTHLGGHVEKIDSESLRICAKDVNGTTAQDFAYFHGLSRIPILACGPLLLRGVDAQISTPGGCEIGPRPINFHLDVLRALGATVVDDGNVTTVSAPNGLAGGRVTLPYPSVGATEQFLLTAVGADGNSELINAATEPEVNDLICVLQKMGAIISVHPNRSIEVIGVPRLGGFDHDVVPDRLEAASWASLALATDGQIKLEAVRQSDLATFLNLYRRAGGEFDVSADGTSIVFRRGSGLLRPLFLETDVHPGFMTDWQSPFVTALTQADGVTVLHETVYERRLGYTKALSALGANIQVFTECLGPSPCRFGRANNKHSAVIVGPAKLLGTDLKVPDLRAGFSYVIAAAAASGVSTISGVSLLSRGYEDFYTKLESVGVRFT